MPKSPRQSLWRIFAFGGGIPAAMMAAWPIFHKYIESENALVATAGVCATFAGFIVAILTILGDASALLPGNWRLAALQAEEIESRSTRLKFTFFCYLASSFLSIYMLAVFKECGPARYIPGFFLTSLVIYSLIISSDLPTTLRSIQQDRISAIIEQRMAADRLRQVPPPDGD